MSAIQQKLNLSDVRYLSRKFLREFIALYKTLPSLWNLKSKLYYDRNQKNSDYNILVMKLKEVEPEANRAMVTQKINSMRSARRKEVMKIKQSMEAGLETHEPKLWYFKLMEFLDGQEVDRRRKVKTEANGDSSSNSPENRVQVDPDTGLDITIPPEASDQSSSASSRCDSEAPSNPVVAFTTHVKPNRKRKSVDERNRKRKSIDETHEAFGRYVAHKMQILPFEQRVYLEKIINEAMFEAELGNLNRNCYVYVPPAADSMVS